MRLQTDKSYVVCVRGTRYAILRIGLFFDGTGNNSYSAEWGLSQFKMYKSKWKAHYAVAQKKGKISVQALPNICFEKPKNIDTHSAANEYTNVQKLFDLYPTLLTPHNDNNIFYHREYITGVGTGNSTAIAPADESNFGAGLGIGDYGVTAKAITAIEQICQNLTFISDAIKDTDGINKIELDVFGFSRGAAAARHFINLVLDGVKGEFAKRFSIACQEADILLCHTFDWQDKAHCEVTFAGLFDTVASVVNIFTGDFLIDNKDTGDARLWLDPKRVTQAVHITANTQTEYRKFFSLNLLNDTDKDNFTEISVPGAHSDIGGGYFSSLLFDTQDYLLPLFARKCVHEYSQRFIYASGKRGENLRKNTETDVKSVLSKYKPKEQALGWKINQLKIETELGANMSGRPRHPWKVIHTTQSKWRVISTLFAFNVWFSA